MYRYIGKGAIMPGVPARDLTDQEWKALPKEWTKAALAAGLYDHFEEAGKSIKKDADESAPKE